jgi:hypothetical protein
MEIAIQMEHTHNLPAVVLMFGSKGPPNSMVLGFAILYTGF